MAMTVYLRLVQVGGLLWFCSSVISPVNTVNYWSKYNLTVGPKPTESSRFIYITSLPGSPAHCMFCSEKALQDSTYAYQQQDMCIRNYGGKNIAELVTQRERENKLYALCSGSGQVPGCGPPPEDRKTSYLRWYCDKGYSLENYSVYFSCALICNASDTVAFSYYCNATLQWELDLIGQKCKAPEVQVEHKSSQNFPLIVIVGLAAGVLLSLVIVAFGVYISCKWHKKRNRRADVKAVQGRNELLMVENALSRRKQIQGSRVKNTNAETALKTLGSQTEDAVPSSVQSSISSRFPSERNDDSAQPLIPRNPHCLPTEIQAGDIATPLLYGARGENPTTDGNEHSATSLPLSVSHTEDEVMNVARSLPPAWPQEAVGSIDEKGAVCGGNIRTGRGAKPSDIVNKPSNLSQEERAVGIRIVCWKDRGKDKNETKISIPIQEGCYSIEKGFNYHIIPVPKQGSSVREFKIVSKGDSPFRGKIEPGMFWYTIKNAGKEDAGLYKWMIYLDTDTKYFEGSFEILIVYPDLINRRADHINKRVDGDGEENPAPAPAVFIGKQLLQQGSLSHLDPNSFSNNPLEPFQNQAQNTCSRIPVRAEIHESISAQDLFAHVPGLSTSMFSRENGKRDSGLSSNTRQSASESFHSEQPQNIVNPCNGLNDRYASTSGYHSQSSRGRAQDEFEAINNGVPRLDLDTFLSEVNNRQRSEAENVADSYPIHPMHDIDQALIERSRLERVEEQAASYNERPEPTGLSVPSFHREGTSGDPDETYQKQLYINNLESARPQSLSTEEESDDGLDERLTSVLISIPPGIQLPEHDQEVPEESKHVEMNGLACPHGEMDALEQIDDRQNLDLHREVDVSARTYDDRAVNGEAVSNGHLDNSVVISSGDCASVKRCCHGDRAGADVCEELDPYCEMEKQDSEDLEKDMLSKLTVNGDTIHVHIPPNHSDVELCR